MARCIICDCSQSADSVYNSSLTPTGSNLIRYVKKFDEELCNDCRSSIVEQRHYWREVDGREEFNAFKAEDTLETPRAPVILEAD
jgi:hypothetical protein